MTRRRVLVVATDPLQDRMPGPAIRAWHLAEVLAADHDVTLAGTAGVTRSHPGMRVVAADRPGRAGLLSSADVAIVPAGVLHEWPEIEAAPIPVVVDLYDPYHLENLEPAAASGEEATRAGRDRRVDAMRSAIDRHLRRGDFFLCASERQRDFWLGSLASAGRVNPYTYDAGPGMDALIAVVPFGLSAAPAVRTGPRLRERIAGIGAGDPVLLWAGGVYNWFDPLSLVRAVDLLRSDVPDVRLVFLGMGHPNPAVPAMRMAAETRRLALDLGLRDRHVFFNEGWVPYEQRASYLLDADVGVSTHLDHIEARFSFRTRVLDYLWAGLPMVLTGGDVLADLVAGEGLGQAVAPGDVDGIRSALRSVLASPDRPDAERFAAVAERFRWDRVAAPLAAFCADPRPAPDRVARPPAPAGSPWAHDATVLARRLVQGALRRLRS
ncbi:glycosyltransferase family 4 protein [Acidiferrimicrobium sp. IK]|uniref:glycosyltransferase family 4 protein n=1 Tax=Acidiferrimicrobium sp. IK TaxID=2871700 RepID=UPI0021CB2842|nr:glycosyltransferase family 4 protein [Acidiferrimicrobium sp. IK]MCU4185560.1 glycosyltransferase family 4 protein [Acidiferrimicrobium sp. IK]